MSLLLCLVQLFLANAANVRQVTVHPCRRLGGGIVVTFVQTQMLRVPLGIGRLDHDRFERVLKHLRIMNIGGHDHGGDWIAPGFGQHAAFGARLGAIGGTGARAIPLKRALPIDVSLLCQSKSAIPSFRPYCASPAHSLLNKPN